MLRMWRGLAAIGVALLVMQACTPRGMNEVPAAQMVRDNDAASLADYLIEGGNPDAVSSDGDPLIYLATGPRGGMDVLTTLIGAGAEIDNANADGRTALMNASGWCDARMVAALLAAGADRDIRSNEGKTARDSVCSGPLDRRAQVLNMLDSAR